MTGGLVPPILSLTCHFGGLVIYKLAC